MEINEAKLQNDINEFLEKEKEGKNTLTKMLLTKISNRISSLILDARIEIPQDIVGLKNLIEDCWD